LFVAESEALADAMRAEQLEVLEVPDVDQAFMVAGAFRPDAIVLVMSQRTNAGLLSAVMLRLDAVTARTPLICLLDSETEPAAALAAGCALALPRSVSADTLVNAVDQLVASRLDGEAPRS
jgi:DNA-binding response OmpR family regulator